MLNFNFDLIIFFHICILNIRQILGQIQVGPTLDMHGPVPSMQTDRAYTRPTRSQARMRGANREKLKSYHNVIHLMILYYTLSAGHWHFVNTSTDVITSRHHCLTSTLDTSTLFPRVNQLLQMQHRTYNNKKIFCFLFSELDPNYFPWNWIQILTYQQFTVCPAKLIISLQCALLNLL